MSIRLLTATLAATLVALPAPSALGQSCEAPPGSAAVDQYCEAVPESDGSQSGNDFQRDSVGPGGSGGGNNRGSGGGALPAGTARQLRDAGAEGAAVERLARTSGASRQTGAANGGSSAGGVAGISASKDEASGNTLKAIPASVENGPVAGPVLVWALLGTTVAVLGAGWVSYRRRSGREDEGPASPNAPTES